MEIKYSSIGTIHTPHKSREGMPIQSAGAKDVKGTIELKKEYQEGLKDLEGFSHIYLIYHFHRSEGFDLEVTPFLDNNPHGVFSTRAPKRPNAIGISIVRLLRVNQNIIEIESADMLDGTPLLDIKPYISVFDIQSEVKDGWLDKNTTNLKGTRSDDRFK